MKRAWTTPAVIRAHLRDGDVHDGIAAWEAIGGEETHPERARVGRWLACRRVLARRRAATDAEVLLLHLAATTRDDLEAALVAAGFFRADCGHDAGAAYIETRDEWIAERCAECESIGEVPW